jgi:DNA excision repair protein ERCC-4
MTNLHQKIAKKALHSGNCLCVLAGGLGAQQLIPAIASEVISRSPRVPPLILIIDGTSASEKSTDEREVVYSAGGVVKVTARVLLSDFLSCRLDPALVNLLILPSAHEVSDTSNEAFIVRLFREGNGKGLLLAVSDKPYRVQLEQLVKNLYLSDLVLVPRFHDLCLQALTAEVDITQHDCQLSQAQADIQALLESVVDASLVEIKKSKIELDEKITGKSLIVNKNEIQALRRKMEPVWLKLSWTTRQIVSDIAVIRKMLVALSRYDCVTFLAIVLGQQEICGKSSPWWFSESAQRVVRIAKDRVSLTRPMEMPALWVTVQEILNPAAEPEIKKSRSENTQKVLIVCPDDLSCKQLGLFLAEGGQRALIETIARSGVIGPKEVVQKRLDELPIEAASFDTSKYAIQCSGCLEDGEGLMSELKAFDPLTVILIEPSLIALRCVEVHKLENVSLTAVHIAGHSGSAVEPKILDLIGREAKSFDDLIRLKNTITYYAKDELFENKRRASRLSVVDSRQGGAGRRKITVNDMIKPTILVDVRELRSALPFLLYRKDFHITPATLTIGDYVLSRDIAVERKSVTGNDLQQSLMSGRLYKQLVNLTHAFPWPVLLLEFTTGKTFQLQSTDASTGEINPSSLIAQIVAICIHFPTLRLVWSPAFTFTANVFARLKQGREQPRIDLGSKDSVSGADPTASVSNTAAKRAIEFLKACPGITAANLPFVMKRVRSVQELVKLDLDQLVSILGKRDGNLFHKFINFQF